MASVGFRLPHGRPAEHLAGLRPTGDKISWVPEDFMTENRLASQSCAVSGPPATSLPPWHARLHVHGWSRTTWRIR